MQMIVEPHCFIANLLRPTGCSDDLRIFIFSQLNHGLEGDLDGGMSPFLCYGKEIFLEGFASKLYYLFGGYLPKAVGCLRNASSILVVVSLKLVHKKMSVIARFPPTFHATVNFPNDLHISKRSRQPIMRRQGC